jgi:UDP-N-acetylglucosamine diphosphorylase / glucose-1-phosphate thymidylyltransferase / UDP-N-acetylgalactosamine diphosphorylase / glucosamine-1-phosphate N-acetyltransferase / galactosamine-1-phosphate N-acetyltransferase
MKVVLVNTTPTSCSFLDYNESEIEGCDTTNCLLNLFGKPIITRNLNILGSLGEIEKILIPRELKFLAPIISSSFKSVIEEVDKRIYKKLVSTASGEDGVGDNTRMDSHYGSKNGYGKNTSSLKQRNLNYDANTLFLPCSVILENNPSVKKVGFQRFLHPWDFLEVINNVLSTEIKKTVISNKSQIAKTSIIERPCVIDDGVIIDDFVKIKGPAYIGKGSHIGMGSLIRNSILEHNTMIGFNCEIGKSYFAGNAKISHHNVILDSLIGKNVWFGGYSGTANVLLTRNNIRYRIEGQLKDTGKNHFGAVVSNNSSIGAAVIIMPGRKIPPNSMIPAGTIYKK